MTFAATAYAGEGCGRHLTRKDRRMLDLARERLGLPPDQAVRREADAAEA